MTTMDENGNIHCIAGDKFDLNWIDIKEDDDLIDFTNWKINLRVFDPTGNKTILEFNETSDINISVLGALRFTKSSSYMNIAIKNYYYDMKFTRPGETDPETWFNNKLFFVE